MPGVWTSRQGALMSRGGIEGSMRRARYTHGVGPAGRQPAGPADRLISRGTPPLVINTAGWARPHPLPPRTRTLRMGDLATVFFIFQLFFGPFPALIRPSTHSPDSQMARCWRNPTPRHLSETDLERWISTRVGTCPCVHILSPHAAEVNSTYITPETVPIKRPETTQIPIFPTGFLI